MTERDRHGDSVTRTAAGRPWSESKFRAVGAASVRPQRAGRGKGTCFVTAPTGRGGRQVFLRIKSGFKQKLEGWQTANSLLFGTERGLDQSVLNRQPGETARVRLSLTFWIGKVDAGVVANSTGAGRRRGLAAAAAGGWCCGGFGAGCVQILREPGRRRTAQGKVSCRGRQADTEFRLVGGPLGAAAQSFKLEGRHRRPG